jgi:phosphoenolpyruvate-protein phosphotransferase (PTS system enzyme I)
MSFALHGIPVSGGIAIGHAHLVSHAKLEAAHYLVPEHQLTDEIKRFDGAIASVKKELGTLRATVPATAPAEFVGFIDVHLMILSDSMLSAEPKHIIQAEQCNAEWALKVQTEALLTQFDQIDDTYLRERRNDVIQVVERVMKALLGQPGYTPPHVSEGRNIIIVARDLSPADVVQFKQHNFASFITDVGGTTSHTAVVARSLNIPSIVALHHARQLIREDELIIVDGTQGVVIVDPDQQALAEYQLRQHAFDLERRKLKRLRNMRATTLDGIDIELHANIELPTDVANARENGATGVGLFRTEFLFLNRKDLPDEEEQFLAYREVAERMEGRPVVLRTLDLGADKALNGGHVGPGGTAMPNPAMGLRAIRFCLAEPQMFLTQLRAILRASQYGKVRILLPMLAHVHEVEQTLTLIRQAKEQLEARGIAYDREVPIGGMIEIPAAALALPIFMRRLNFLSIGTNDLIQYTLAIDRTDDAVAHLYDPLHPAVLTLVAGTIHAATRGGVPVAVCGEMAGDPQLTRLLLGLGLRNFSMHPSQLLAIKERVLRTNLAEAQPLAQRVLRNSDPAKTRELLARLNA